MDTKCKRIDTYGDFCEALYKAVFGEKCVFCPKKRYNKKTVCKTCYDSCPNKKPAHGEVAVRVKIQRS